MSDEFSEVGSLIDRRVDSHGNEWYLLHKAQRVEPLLKEDDEVDRIVITPAGRKYLKAYGRPRLFKDFIDGELLEGHLPIQDGEGIFSVVWPASDRELDTLMKNEGDIPPHDICKKIKD